MENSFCTCPHEAVWGTIPQSQQWDARAVIVVICRSGSQDSGWSSHLPKATELANPFLSGSKACAQNLEALRLLWGLGSSCSFFCLGGCSLFKWQLFIGFLPCAYSWSYLLERETGNRNMTKKEEK